MSVSHHAYVVFGILISNKVFIKKIRQCSHPEPTTAYCGICGKPTFI